MKQASAWLAAAYSLIAMWLVTPDPGLSALAALFAVCLFEIGFRWQALSVIGVVWLGQFEPGLQEARLAATPMVMASLYWLWRRTRRLGMPAVLLSWAAALVGVFFIGKEAGEYAAPVYFVVFALGLLCAAIRLAGEGMRVQSYCIATLAALWTLSYDIDPPHLIFSTLTAAGIYACALLARRAAERRPTAYFSVLGSLLVLAILWGKVSGGLLTTCWAFTGLALLAGGFIVHARVLRLQGLTLLLVCVLKAFLYDLRNLETIYRILSFVMLGLILIAVSWIYTRFRDHINRLLH